MDKNEPNSNLLSELSANPPKVIGGYKKQGWAIKVLENTSNLSVEKEDGGKVTAKAVLEANDKTYYPAFITLDLTKKGKLSGAYLIAEKKDQYDLIPFEIAKSFLNKEEELLLPLKYRTLEQIDGDEIQVNWPDFV